MPSKQAAFGQHWKKVGESFLLINGHVKDVALRKPNAVPKNDSGQKQLLSSGVWLLLLYNPWKLLKKRKHGMVQFLFRMLFPALGDSLKNET